MIDIHLFTSTPCIILRHNICNWKIRENHLVFVYQCIRFSYNKTYRLPIYKTIYSFVICYLNVHIKLRIKIHKETNMQGTVGLKLLGRSRRYDAITFERNKSFDIIPKIFRNWSKKSIKDFRFCNYTEQYWTKFVHAYKKATTKNADEYICMKSATKSRWMIRWDASLCAH